MGRWTLYVGIALLAIVVLAGCAPGPNPNLNAAVDGKDPAGFLLGIWHGMILWITFIVSLFNSNVSIYEVHNTGWSYNLGFLIGATGVLGGGVAGSRKKRETAD